MIRYNPKNWFKLIFALHKSDTIWILWKEMIYIGVFTLFIAYIFLTYFPDNRSLEKLIAVYSLVGFVISLLLVFRTNTAYDRWWEGRKKWGSLVNDTRNLSIKLGAILKEEEDRRFFRKVIPAFVFATRDHLRNNVDVESLGLDENTQKKLLEKDHIPNAITAMLYNKVVELKSQKKITEQEFIVLDTNMNALLDSLGACERIKNTPIPYSYMLFLKKFIFIYVTTLPLAFVTIFGYYSAIVATVVFYVLVSMEVLAEEIEDPFGVDDNDLPTDQLSEKINANVEEILS